jgi:UDP-N-acetylmuramoyl-L-alanyl-D-glutamate--2,6-diaminopimelate ligase
MEKVKNWLKQYVIPLWLMKFVRPFYHGLLAVLASWYYGRPSQKMVVIGITGTAGKSTTAVMLAHLLNYHPLAPSYPKRGKCGYITTVSFFDGWQEYKNKHGLSMPGGFMLQKQLRKMLENGCNYAVVECTSEGLAQNRHLGIEFDMAILTNLYGAHLEAHGGFDNYKLAKGKLFEALKLSKLKHNLSPAVPTLPSLGEGGVRKTIVVNVDDPNAEFFTKFKVDKIVRCGIRNQRADFVAHDIKAGEKGIQFSILNSQFSISLVGEFNAANALLAVASAESLGVEVAASAKALADFKGVPGRMELIENSLGFKIFVDYGCEPASFQSALLAASQMPHQKIIHVFGSTGGHRDVSKRFEFGRLSAQYADQIIITNDDVYDSDPQKIAEDIKSGISEFLNLKSKILNLEVILDRRQAIYKALSTAGQGDIVLITGKGSEQFLVLPGNQRISWDEREVVREELQQLTIND